MVVEVKKNHLRAWEDMNRETRYLYVSRAGKTQLKVNISIQRFVCAETSIIFDCGKDDPVTKVLKEKSRPL